MQPEVHLFLIWQTAYCKLQEIAQDISHRFDVLFRAEILWSVERFSDNLTQFYGTRLPPKSFKERHCGTGPFTVIVVRDRFPEYRERATSKGIKTVNVRMFDAKARYRSWTGGGHRIHATNSLRETEHDLMLLLGKTAVEIEQEYRGAPCTVAVIDRDPEGATGWRSLTHLFGVLNRTVDYVVLRNHENLGNADLEGGDIDVLTDEPKEFQFVARARRIYLNRRRCAFRVEIDGQDVHCDVRFCGDNYYDEAWERRMLRDRMRVGEGPHVLCPRHYFYSLLYHALIHKPSMSEIYRERLKKMAGVIGGELSEFGGHEERWRDILWEYLGSEGYVITIPKDYSVFFNRANVSVFRRDFVTQAIRAVRAGLKRIESGLQ